MSAPTTADWFALLRLARSLMLQPRAVRSFPWQDEGAAIRTFVDADFAGCFRTRRSTRGGVCARGVHTIKDWSATQKTLALSSGEAELAGI
eukprot:14640261-Alexandrium_andersonii.AAC.1